MGELIQFEYNPSYLKGKKEWEESRSHADGMVRFVDKDTILGNDLNAEYKYIRDGINKACSENGLHYINVPFFEQKYDKNHELNAIGIYVNYLEVDNLIVLPKFNVEGNRDEEAIFPDRIIETVDYNEVAVEGGLLNCKTWTIRE